MIFIGIIASIAAIAILCWLLFTLAVFALPAFAGATVGAWAYQSGAGLLGAAAVGIAAAGITLGLGHLLLVLLRPMWLKLLVAAGFVAPAAIAGFYATYGIVRHFIPSETWQFAFAIIGGVTVGVTAFIRIAGMAAPDTAGQSTVRA